MNWSVVYQQEWFTPNVECQERGKGDGKETEGLAFLSPNPLGDLDDDQAAVEPDRADREAARLRAALPITVTHLANGKTERAGARERSRSPGEMDRQKLGGDSALLGDFNLKPDEVELQPMLTTVSRCVEDRRRCGRDVGHGSDARRQPDRFHLSQGEGAGVTASRTRSIRRRGSAPAASDHRPVVATVRLPHVLK